MDNKIQIAEFSFPFPAKSFENELIKANVGFSTFEKVSYEGGFGSQIFYVEPKDVEIAFKLKSKVEEEDAISTQKNRHPIKKIIAYVGLALAVIYGVIKIVEIINHGLKF